MTKLTDIFLSDWVSLIFRSNFLKVYFILSQRVLLAMTDSVIYKNVVSSSQLTKQISCVFHLHDIESLALYHDHVKIEIGEKFVILKRFVC